MLDIVSQINVLATLVMEPTSVGFVTYQRMHFNRNFELQRPSMNDDIMKIS